MTVTDNTKTGVRAFSPEGIFGFPQVAYAPDFGTGMGGFMPQIAYAPEGEGAGGGDSDDGGADDVDPNKDIDNPADDMYPEQSNKGGKDDDKSEDDKSEDDKSEDDKSADDKDDDKSDDDKSDDDKSEDDKDDDKDDDDKKEVDLKSVPEDGKYVLTMPEGMELDQALLDEVSPLLKEKGYTHEEAQALTDKFIASRTAEIEKASTSWDETVAKWGEDTKADKEIGGDKFEGSLTTAKATLDKYGTPELKAALDNSGMGSHPELIRLLVKVGHANTDDDVPNPNEVTRKAGSNSNADAAEELYGDTTPTKRG